MLYYKLDDIVTLKRDIHVAKISGKLKEPELILSLSAWVVED